MLDLDPIIKIYKGSTPYLDGFDILQKDANYRQIAFANSNNDKCCDRLFVQMKHFNAKAGEQKAPRCGCALVRGTNCLFLCWRFALLWRRACA